ncbi:MAG: BlaI/MecI/CopY family transcriptional regulator [Oscillospiraceae bacterium]|nr:BlaI/MecI/CopY family transcriptional regulator [Oscillospiraceae bacterium]
MYLTKNEIEIMDVLWREGRALSRGEILGLSEDKTWMDSSVHILLNSMLKKGAIREAGFVKCGKTCGRVYEAALSCEEYHVSTFSSTKVRPAFPRILRAYIDQEGLSAGEIKELQKILKETSARED